MKNSLTYTKNLSKMKVLPIYGAILFIYGIQAMCPTLRVHPKDSFDFGSFDKFILYQFKPVDYFVQTPFFKLEGATRRSFFGNHAARTECTNKFFFYFNQISFINFNNTTNKFDLSYDDEDNLFCYMKNKMSEIYLVDFEAKYLASIYGCEMFLINGIMTKVEGVLIFLNYNRNNLTVSTDALSRLNYTYEVLQKQANLSRTTLKTKVTEMNNKTNESCMNIINLLEHCRQPLLQIIIPKKLKISNDTVIILICSGFLIAIVVSFACARQNTLFL